MPVHVSSSSTDIEHSTRERFVVVTPDTPWRLFDQQLKEMLTIYDRFADNMEGLSRRAMVGATIFVSDIENQGAIVNDNDTIRAMRKIAPITVVQQPPIKTKVAMLVHLVRRHDEKRSYNTMAQDLLTVEHGPYTHSYLRGLMGGSHPNFGIRAQTTSLFEDSLYVRDIKVSSLVRTWFYLRNIDTDYQEFSGGRNAVFRANEITSFPASTGIGGAGGAISHRMMMDAVAITGLQEGQSNPMSAPGFMGDTTDYNVTFERGREVIYGDRRHLYISGTASINTKGEIMFLGDAMNQTRRAIVNVECLLENHDAKLSDMRYLIVYVRDMHDAAVVEHEIVHSGLREVPRIIVQASVCRPGWLVEMEGLAIDNKGDSRFSPF